MRAWRTNEGLLWDLYYVHPRVTRTFDAVRHFFFPNAIRHGVNCKCCNQ